MEQNKIRTYLPYALGEVFLVVIGILIALQVNNWNEERKAAIEEQIILSSLLDDLEFATNESKEMITRDSMDVEILKGFLLGDDLSHLAEKQRTVDSLIIIAIWGVGQSTPVIQTYNDIKSSGKTALIKNEEIRNKLALIEFNANEIRNSLNDKLIVQQFQVDQIAAQHLDMVTFLDIRNGGNSKQLNNNYIAILNNEPYKNTIASKQMLSHGLYLDRVAFNDLLFETIQLIRKEMMK